MATKTVILFAILCAQAVLAWSGRSAGDVYGSRLKNRAPRDMSSDDTKTVSQQTDTSVTMTETSTMTTTSTIPANSTLPTTSTIPTTPSKSTKPSEPAKPPKVSEEGRLVRDAMQNPHSCTDPDLKFSELKCVKNPEKIVCQRYCAFGYTTPKGIRSEIYCHYSGGGWIGMEGSFGEVRGGKKEKYCQPFLDCKVEIGYGGKISCTANGITEGPECEISCERFEDFPAVPKAKYKCDVSRGWVPPLPPCARVSGQELVPVPNGARQHTESDLEMAYEDTKKTMVDMLRKLKAEGRDPVFYRLKEFNVSR